MIFPITTLLNPICYLNVPISSDYDRPCRYENFEFFFSGAGGSESSSLEIFVSLKSYLKVVQARLSGYTREA